MQQRKRYAVVGTGGRCITYIDAIVDRFKDHNQLVAMADISPTRVAWHNQRLARKFQYPNVPFYHADDFDRMVKETKPDEILVTSMDCTHHQYIVRAMELGCDVICEKPMTIDAPKARQIVDAIQRTGRKLRVTFNFRYSPAAMQIRELMMRGVVGRPLAVDLSWVLDTSHGADYFRRWHREKDKSGGLLVHKSTHHFDIVNWWIDSFPQRVHAMGALKFYGRKNAEARGEHYDYDRYTGSGAKGDPFALFLNQSQSADPLYGDDTLTGLYMNAEKDSGYVRDRNVFGEGITIEDTMAVQVLYKSGVIMNYSLVAYSPWEGLRVAITGDKGRLEYFVRHGAHIVDQPGQDAAAVAEARKVIEELRVFPMFGVPYSLPIQKLEGTHGGADPLLVADLFSPNPPADPLNRAASYVDGAASMIIGVSANESMRTAQPVNCDDLLPLPAKSAGKGGV